MRSQMYCMHLAPPTVLTLRQGTTTDIIEHRPRRINQPDAHASTVCRVGPAVVHSHAAHRRAILVDRHRAIGLGAGTKLVACRQGEGNIHDMLHPAPPVVACPDLGRASCRLIPDFEQVAGRAVLRFEQQIDLAGICILVCDGREACVMGSPLY